MRKSTCHTISTLAMSVLVAAGCSQAITVGDAPGDSGFIADLSFPIRTHGLNRLSSALVIVGTDLPVDSGCSLTGSEQLDPGRAARMVYARFAAFAAPSACTEGTYTIASNQSYCSTPILGELPENCAVYKRWNEWGALVERVLATGGAAWISKTDLGYGASRCTVRVDLQFGASGSYGDTFSVDSPEAQLPIEPLCTEITCAPECPPWQSCTPNGCMDSGACIAPHVSCPLNGTPSCCVPSATRELSCNLISSGTACCVPAGRKCDFNENDCCPPYRCSIDQTCG